MAEHDVQTQVTALSRQIFEVIERLNSLQTELKRQQTWVRDIQRSVRDLEKRIMENDPANPFK